MDTRRLLLVYDVENWAWFYRCSDLQRFAPSEYDVQIISHNDFVKRFKSRPEELREFSAVYSSSWTMSPLDILTRAKRSVCLCTCSGLLYDRRIEDDWQSRIVTASRNTARARERLPQFGGVVAVNRKLYDACKKHNPNTMLIPSGVNTQVFTPGPRQPVNPDKLTIGWCGQRRANMKGLAEVLEPLKRRLSGPEYEWRVNDRNFGEAMTREEMVAWYHGIDVFICTSIVEGTPSPPMEAAACARVVLTTDVGIMSDWEFLAKNGLLCPGYYSSATAVDTVNWFADHLEAFRRRPDELPDLGAALRESVHREYSYDGAGIARKYLDFIAGVSP